jgi:hypothetical protein
MDQPARPGRRAHRDARAGGGERPWPEAALPASARDRNGRRLAPGDVVRIGGGEHAGQLAEVLGWGGRRGIELVIHGRPPRFVAARPRLLELVDVRLVDPVVPRDRSRSD